MQTYRRFVSYVYQYENGKKAGNRGFIKVEARGNTCSMQIALKGVCRDGNGKCRIFGFKREDGLLKGSLLAECTVKTGIVQEQLAFLRSSMGNAGYSLHELSGVIFQGDDETMYGTQWDDEPMKMENFQPDENNVARQGREEPQTEELVNEESMESEQEWPVQEELREEILEGAREQTFVAETPRAEPEPETVELAAEESELGAEEEPAEMVTPEPIVIAEVAQEERTAMEASAPAVAAEVAREERESVETVAPVIAGEVAQEERASVETAAPVIEREVAQEERASVETVAPVIAGEVAQEEGASVETVAPVIEREVAQEEKATVETMAPVAALEIAQEERASVETMAPTIAVEGGREEKAAETIQMTREAQAPNPPQKEIEQVEMIAAPSNERRAKMASEMEMRPPQSERPDVYSAGTQEKKERQPEVKKSGEQQIETARELPKERQNPENPRPSNILPHTGAEEENFVGAEKMEEGPLEILDTTVDISDLNRDDQDNYIKPDMEAENISEKRRFNPFTDGVLEDCQKITLDDLMRLDPRDQGLRNNRFVQHGYQMFGHLLLAKVARNSQYILGVPGIYQQQEKFMADMFGFHNFKCARRRGAKTPCFGYWYRLIYPPKLCMRNKCSD